MNKRPREEVPDPKTVPFRRYVPAGASHFDLPIPASFRHLSFNIAYALFYAEFYSTYAALMDLDTDFDLDEEVVFDINFHCKYPYDDTVHPGIFQPEKDTNTVVGLVHDFNKFFEINKPVGMASTCAFIDWTDTRRKDAQVSLKVWVEEMMAQEYYGERFNAAKHFNALPVSARKIEGANNYLFPTQFDDDMEPFIANRLNIAPNTSVNFSNKIYLLDLGFSPEQIGEKNGKKRFVMKNERNEHYQTITGVGQLQTFLTKTNNLFKVTLRVNNKNYISNTVLFKMTKRDTFVPEKYEAAIHGSLQFLEALTNIRVGFKFDPNKRKFQFVFPPNQNLKNLFVIVHADLAERLGFGLINEINVENRTGEKIHDDKDNIQDARKAAAAIANDVGILVITDQDSSSNTTVGVYERVLCSLFSDNEGMMKYRPTGVTTSMKIAKYLAETDGFVTARLRLFRYVDDGHLVPFVWKVGAWVHGILVGT